MPVARGSQRGRGGLSNRGGRGRSATANLRVSQSGRGQAQGQGRGRGEGRGRGGRTSAQRMPQAATGPRMTSKTWLSIKDPGVNDHDGERRKLTPDVLTHGLPPDPMVSDAYADKWKKLILMEFHASLSEFRRDQRKRTEPFDDLAHVHVEFQGKNEKTGQYDVRISTEIKTSDGRVIWKAKDPSAVSPADLVKTLLKTQSGWLYITKCKRDDNNRAVTECPVECNAIAYSDSFARDSLASEPGRAIVFDSFTTLIYRFESLCAFETETDADIKKVIESGLIHACRERKSVLKPVAKDARAKSKLNDSQFDVLTKIRAPVDFVQGPPGTGKSTFIVEYVKTRLPQRQGSRVLICTTTNKAIDSLTEKLAASGCGNEMLAVGNAARLGPTSAQFLLKNRVERHAGVQAFERQVLLTEAYRGLGLTYGAMKARHDELIKILDDEASTKEQVNEAKAAMDGVFATLSSSAKRSNACPKSLREHKLIERDLIKSIEETRQSLRRAMTISELLDAVGCYRAAVSHAAESIRSNVRTFITTNARYVVCTAAVAASLPDRMAREMSPAATSDSKSDASDASADRTEYTFEHVILDEAGAMLEPDVIGTTVHGCRSLLSVGDHKQLPPFTKWRWGSKHDFDVSLMMRLSRKAAKNHNMMTIQYRMHPHLAKIVSSQFYGNALKTAESTTRERTRSQPVVFAEVEGEEETRGKSFLNRHEIAAVVALVQKERLANSTQTINVICFHKPQFKEIRRELVKLGLMKEAVTSDAPAQLPTLDVCTVDSMQGREADVVILSCVRTNQNSVGFLANVNRVNVALSRAKQVLYIVGNRASLSTNATWRKVLNHQHVKRETVG